MALPHVGTRTPTTTGRIDIHLTDIDGTTQLRRVRGRAETLDQDDNEMPLDEWSGDLVPHLSQAQIDWLASFLDDMRILSDGRFT
jgi:hypothetical protein